MESSMLGTVRAVAGPILLIPLIALALCAPCVPASAQNDWAPDVLVRVASGVDITAVAAYYGTVVDGQVSTDGMYTLAVPAGVDPYVLAVQLLADPRITSAEPETLVGMPEYDGKQMHLPFDSPTTSTTVSTQTAFQQVDLSTALPLATGTGIVVAVVDTGVALDHPALAGHLGQGFNAVDPTLPPYEVPDGLFNLAMGHGTMIAGVMANLAPGATVMPIRVLNGDGIGASSSVIQGIDYAVTHGARIINLSFGSFQYSPALAAEIQYAQQQGVVVVAAAGNDGVQAQLYPAALPGVIAVTAVESDNTKSSYSNYGTYICCVAPGTAIQSTFWDGGYATWTGTSFSAPMVAAEAALILSVRPSLEPEDVLNRIRKTSHSVGTQNPAYSGLLGTGIIDLGGAVKSTISSTLWH